MTRRCCDLCGTPLPDTPLAPGSADLRLDGTHTDLRRVQRRRFDYCPGSSDDTGQSCLDKAIAALESLSLSAIPTMKP